MNLRKAIVYPLKHYDNKRHKRDVAVKRNLYTLLIPCIRRDSYNRDYYRSHYQSTIMIAITIVLVALVASVVYLMITKP